MTVTRASVRFQRHIRPGRHNSPLQLTAPPRTAKSSLPQRSLMQTSLKTHAGAARQCHVRPGRRRSCAVAAAGSNGGGAPPPPPLQVSRRVRATDAPVIVKTKALMARAPKDKQVLSLAQGIVHWQPPPEAVQLAAQLLASGDASIHGYGPAEGLPPLRDALRHKIASRNGLEGYQVMVTAGANQAFVNLVLALCDSSDATVLFSPHYFNHAMALQMTGGAPSIRYGPCHPDTFHPNLDWLQQQLTDPEPPKMVVLVNPCNPTGVLLPREELQRAAEMTAAAGTWLILDNTYEDFVYDGRQHHAVSGPNVINLFSFSKAYGMMGWRVGYIAYPGQQLLEQGPWQPGRNLVDELLKVQDTIPICPSQLSQHVALAALQHGSDYITQQIANLAGSRALIADALSPLGSQGGGGWVGNEGAIYCWGKLPERFSSGASSSANGSSSGGVGGLPAGAGTDEDVVEWLIREHGVCVIPGSACGVPGCIRVAFANLKPAEMAVAAARLKAGLQQLVGMDSVVRA